MRPIESQVRVVFVATAVIVVLVCGCGSEKGEKETQMPESSPVTFFKSDDPEMSKASEEAQRTFRCFWKEVSLDFNRIVPALELACIKLPFSDDPSHPESQVEHMWVSDIDFDGEKIRGVLMNSPNWLESVEQGDAVECTPGEISDWMCVLDGKVFGAYTVQVVRGRMSDAERESHDADWGLDFPPPGDVLVPPDTAEFESVIASLLEEHLEKNPAAINSTDSSGRTPLHLEALYGRKHSVKVLLDHGASVRKRCGRGWTPKDYAKALNWTEVIRLLEATEAEQADARD